MKRVSVCVLVAAMAVLCIGLARAERESEYRQIGPEPAKPRPPAARPGMFAAGSAAGARRMTPEQRDEWRFLKTAAAASRFESEASRLAMNKSGNPRVRAFAAMLVDHHGGAGTALQYMLHGRGMAPPMLADDQRKILNRLAKLHGARFDREYIEQVGLRYQLEDVRLYEDAAATVHDPALRAWVSGSLPVLRDHLDAAQRLVPPADARVAKDGRAAPMRTGAARPVVVKPIGSNSR